MRTTPLIEESRVGWRQYVIGTFAASPGLCIVSILMIFDVVGTTVGMMTDHTIITGMPAWVKPTKFAISTGIYAASLAIVIRETQVWRRALKIVDALTALALVLEILLIDLQAYRHTTSHFNNSTPFDTYVFSAMGLGIAVLWLSAIVAAAATFRYRYPSELWGVVARAGMLLVVLGSGTGAFMAAPSRAQIAERQITHHMPISGSHTVGAPDGEPGLPILGWSTEHGDVRIAHFVGIHGIQVLALLALLFERRRLDRRKGQTLMRLGALVYGGFFFLLLYQALKGESLIRPDRFVGAMLGTLLVAAVAIVLAAFSSFITGSPRLSTGVNNES
jgi:hypothetical protein